MSAFNESATAPEPSPFDLIQCPTCEREFTREYLALLDGYCDDCAMDYAAEHDPDWVRENHPWYFED